MKLLKVFILAVLFISVYSETFSQEFYFTYTGPTTVTVPYGASSVNATYYFNYYNNTGQQLIRPRLGIERDSEQLTDPICTGGDAFLPSSFTISFTPGTHTVRFTLSDLGQANHCSQANIWQVVNLGITTKFTVRNENIFTVGSIYVDNYSVIKNSPFDRSSAVTNNYAIGAIDQDFDGYHWIWNNSGINNSKWQRQPQNSSASDYSPDRNTNYTVQESDNSTKLIAGLRKICKPNFQNNFVSVGNGGVIKVNNTQYNSPTSQFDVVELNPISATAVYQVINGIGYSFQQWNDESTTVTKTFNPNSTQTYTAYYIGKPLTTNRALHTGTVYNQPVVLYWNEHPNTNVTQYQIWRRVKHNGVMSDPQIIATVNRGTTSYVDDEYNLTRNYSNDLLYYDVRPYYSTENTYADPNWLAVYGVLMPKTSDSTMTSTLEFENSLSNFPNPFNPTTNIKYSIKESGQVSIKVFDLIGQQIIELVNEEKAAGNYSILFDASQLPSGIYIYTIQSGNFFNSKKLILLK